MKLKIISIILIVIIALECLGVVTIAATQSELENEQNEINSQIEDTEDEIDEIQSQISSATQEVQDLITQISSYEASISSLNEQITEKESEISAKEQEIIDTENQLEEKQDLLDKRLVALYECGETSYIDLLLSSADLTDFVSKYYLISEIATYDTDLIESIKEIKASLETAKSELETAKSELESNKSELETTKASLESAKSEKETKVASLTAEEASLTEELEELQERESQVSSQIQTLKEEYDRKIAAEKAAAAAAAASSSSSSSSSSSNSISSSSSSTSSSNLSSSAVSSYGFGWPVANPSTLGTLYGVSGSLWTLGYHTGIDFRVSKGTAIYSIGDGQVVDVGYSSAYGNYVEIYHGNNIYSFYAHNTSVIVSQGSYVTRGQQISYSGATGNVTGPHLHFEIRTPSARFSSCVNPLTYLP